VDRWAPSIGEENARILPKSTGCADTRKTVLNYEEANMPREAKLFDASSGSVVRGFLKLRANIPPRWIQNARSSRKRSEPEIVRAFGDLKRLRKTRPHARVTIKNAVKELRRALNHWETAHRKETFYRGLRVLLELQRNGASKI
jgi:hypothetical protein